MTLLVAWLAAGACVDVAWASALDVRLHATSKAVVLGVAAIAVATAITGEDPTIARALLVSVALAFTSPVATHAIARAACRREASNARRTERGTPAHP